jgi:hypothetical protein
MEEMLGAECMCGTSLLEGNYVMQLIDRKEMA